MRPTDLRPKPNPYRLFITLITNKNSSAHITCQLNAKGEYFVQSHRKIQIKFAPFTAQPCSMLIFDFLLITILFVTKTFFSDAFQS